ncbi:MAG: hypothetical protein DMF53_29675 [Acidobacteria bacterium]|nr:MAG: hypothetical protein DMF53_29675 [Acidobacteriota bacterium]
MMGSLETQFRCDHGIRPASARRPPVRVFSSRGVGRFPPFWIVWPRPGEPAARACYTSAALSQWIPMIVEKKHLDGFTLLNVEGVIKLGESAQFFAQTLERTLSDDRGHVIIDFSKINFIDSTGIGELVGYLGRFRSSKRDLILVNPSDRIRKLLHVARLDDLFPTYDSVQAAIAAER